MRQRSFDELGAPLSEVPFCVVDLETTGASPATSAITEIGAIRYLGGEETGRFQTLVNPQTEIPPFITVLTGITHAMVVEAPTIAEALPSFLEFLGTAVIVGHNLRFDLSFLQAAARELGYPPLTNRTVDTLALARRLVRGEVRNLKLETLAAHFAAPRPPTHRALADAEATAHVFWELLGRAGALGVTHLEDLLELPTARGTPTYGKLALTERLPRRPGVYRFVDRDGTTFYVGKAKNLRSRVRAYFYGDDRRSVAQMLRELERIDHTVCATELEAEIAELRAIAAERPRHNRRSRPPRTTHWVKLTAERYPRLSVVRTLGDGGPYLGPFRSKRAADRVVHALWDAVPIRRCRRPRSGSGRCAFAQLGVACCPCGGAVDDDEYAEVVERLRAGIERDPQLLLEPLRARMTRLALARRFEEAAELRDRHRSLARALERRRRWRALAAAGRLWAEDRNGEGLVVDDGVFVAAWNASSGRPLLPPYDPSPVPEVPPTVAHAEEADLLWRWLDRDGVEIVESTAPLALPARPVPVLVTA
ncbi:MAG TPA: DEDD exonuclease domain-containing protein [Actinobacteria bacterium]|nr:DEDD exonuclease domain-containing protein [Actinomycetota bacterium]